MEGESSSRSDTLDSTPEWKYDVFLSFTGKDTRLKFVDHLDEAFKISGIKTFKDEEDLERGGDIQQNLFQAIQDSLCAVVVISENYANSTWCLDELQKILESQNTLDRRVFPIFYDVDPADVRHQRKRFGEALAEHEDKFTEDMTKVPNWKNVLCQIANLSGWDTRGRHEADLIKIIVREVWAYLSSKLPSYDDNLVGIDSRVAVMISILEIGSDDKRFVGIWGMGGLGKTTLARVVYEKISHKFEVRCFLANVRETLLQREGLISMQKKLLAHLKIKDMEIFDGYDGMKIIRKLLKNKKVLFVLDDIDDMRQLKNLAESPTWFGRGSRIIITTRYSQLLTSARVGERIYEMKTMEEDESLQLFSNKAFNKDQPKDTYLELSKSVVKYAGGLPLALEVLGSFLCGRSEVEWRDALDRLQQIPDDNILQVLKISYDGLSEEEKTIFLDIACFFKGWWKKEVTQILKNCDLHATIGIKVLIDKTLLVETEDRRLEMHDLLEGLGKHIVRQESPNDVGKRSRLWEFEDIKEVLENNKGSDAIQAIVIRDLHYDFKYLNKIKVHPEAYSKMSNLRLLLNRMSDDSLILPWGMELPGALKVVYWSSFPLEALPLPLDKVVDIRMTYSKIKQLWNGIQFMGKLKFLDLSRSTDFIETPDFTGVPYLEHLHLRECTSLIKVHPSLGELKNLIEVQLTYCGNLEILPRKLETNSLTKLSLRGCKKVAVLPEFGKGMKKLSYLDVRHTSITRLPESLGSFTGLRDLDLSHCKIFNVDKLLKPHISRQLSGLNVTSLTELYLSECGLNDGSIPDDFGCLSSLIVLDLSGNDFVNLPTSCFSSLFRLVFLSLDCCMKLKSLPRLPPRLIRLNASHCNSMEPLSLDGELWNLVASLDHQYRGQTKYVITNDENGYSPLGFEYDESEECHHLRNFCAIIPGHKILSWFSKKEYYTWCGNRGRCVIKMDIPPPNLRDSEWYGIVVCLLISGSGDLNISWSSKAVEDDDYIRNKWGHSISSGNNHELCIMVLKLNEKTCCQHLLTPHNYFLHIKLLIDTSDETQISGSGWRVICKEDIKEWCNLNGLTLPQLASPHEVNLSRKVVDKFIQKVSPAMPYKLKRLSSDDDVLDGCSVRVM